MPFSFSMAWMPSMISWLMSLPLVDQIGPHDGLVRDSKRFARSWRSERDGAVGGLDHLALEAVPSLDLTVGPAR